MELVARKLGIDPVNKPTTDDFLFSIEQVSCLGACGMAPVMQVNEKLYGLMTQAKLEKLIDDIKAQESAQ